MKTVELQRRAGAAFETCDKVGAAERLLVVIPSRRSAPWKPPVAVLAALQQTDLDDGLILKGGKLEGEFASTGRSIRRLVVLAS